MKTLITGGAGFIGSNLARRLEVAGREVVVLDDLSSGRESNLSGLNVRFVRGSITSAADVQRAIQGCDSVVHLAARGSVPRSLTDPLLTHEINASSTLTVLEVARETGAYVLFASSSSVYGQNPQLPKTESSWTRPVSPYGASKLSAEGYVQVYRSSFGLSTQVLRFFNVFGPGQLPDHDYAAVIPKWIYRIQRGLPIEVHGDGWQTRDFTYVDTVTSVLADAIDRNVSIDGPINLALGQRRSLNEVLAVIQEVLGNDAVVEYVEARRGDIRDSQNDPDLLNSVFPVMEQIEFREAVQKTTRWLVEEFLSASDN